MYTITPTYTILLKHLFCVFILLLIAAQPLAAETTLPGPARLQELDQLAIKTNSKYATDIKTLAAHLNKAATSDYERARLAFAWVAHNIRYNDIAYNSNAFGDGSAEVVLKTRIAVCDGYANLFKALGEEMGLKVERISGYAKGFGYRPGGSFARTNHAWNSVYIDGKWHPMDVTWAAGSGTAVNGRLKTVYKYDPYWFDTDPFEFLWTHLPEEPQHQYVTTPITMAQYRTLPAPDVSLFQLGFHAKSVLNLLLKGQVQTLPKTWETDLNIRFNDVPLASALKANKSYTFSLKAAPDVDLIVKNGNSWHRFEERDGVHKLTLRPVQGKLAFMAKPKGSKGNFFYFLEYDITR